MSVSSEFFVNLAASLAFELLRAGAARLRQAALGTPQEQALHRAYEAAFEATLRASAPAGDEAAAHRIADHLRRFLDLPDVADTLLDMALLGSPAPNLERLGERFAALAVDGDAPPLNINRILAIFHGRLTTALLDEASTDGSPLYDQVSLGRILAVHGLLHEQQHSLRAISQRLQRMEAQGGAVYNIVIEQATGLAIGDGATVNQFPQDVRLALAEVLAALKELNVARRPPAYSQEDLRRYLQTVVEQCATLNLHGAGGPVDRLPLERVYVALKADASNVAERRANRQQFLDDLAAHEQALAQMPDLDQRQYHQIKRAVARGLDPMGLTLALRNRASMEQGDYLARAARRIDLGELVGQERWAVLLGDPGAGKTTLIRWLALQFARSLLDGETRVRVPGEQVRADADAPKAEAWVDLGPARLPAPLRLADYAAARWKDGHDSALSLFDYLGKQPWLRHPLHPDQAVGQAIVHEALRQGRALILLDGLDEITDQFRRGQVVDAIVHFLRTWVRDPLSGLCAAEEGYAPAQERAEERPRAQGGNQVLITSRPIGYYLAPLPPTLAHYTVEEMSEPAIAAFCRAWTAAVHQETGAGDPAADAKALRQAVLDPDRPALREIAANPLLLTILAGLFYTLKGRLPERRVELYDEMVEAFIRQRHEAWQAQGLSDARFRFAMGYAAVQLHANPERASQLAGEDDLKEWLAEALEAFEGQYAPKQDEQAETLFASAAGLGGFLLERGDGAYGFIHRTLQEYFAALYLAHNRATVAGEVCRRLDEPAWHVPLTLAVAHTAAKKKRALPGLLRAILDAPEPAPGLLPRNALFLAACLPECQEPPPAELAAEVVGQLLAAYADRAWPVDETTRPLEVLRRAIERSLRPLRRQPGAQQALADALTGADPARRLAAGELILALDWQERALVGPLLAATRDHAEPVAVIREALWRCVRADPGALSGQELPLRRLLASRETVNALRQRPAWLAIVQSLYLRPDWTLGQPLDAAAVCFDSLLTPDLLQAWQEGWSDEQLLDQLMAWAGRAGDPALARDAAWAAAVADDGRWRSLLASSGDGAALRCTIAGLAWGALALDRDRDLALDRDLARALALDRDRDLALDRDRDLALDLALARALDLALARDLDRDLDEIDGIVAGGRGQFAEDPEASDLLAALDAAADRVAQLRMVLQHPAWRALRSAAELLPPQPGAAGRRAGRIPWDGEALDVAATLAPDRLARLQVPRWAEPALRTRLQSVAEGWLGSPDGWRAALGALLLAELGQISLANLDRLVPLLMDADDLLRGRARAALQQERPASVWGQEALAALAVQAGAGREPAPSGVAAAEDGGLLISTYCGWTLKKVMHDRADWLAGWAARLDAAPSEPTATLLSHIHRLEAGCWPPFVELLHTAGPRSQEALLESTGWLLRLGRVPEEQTAALGEALLAVARAAPEKVTVQVVLALGCFRRPPPAVVQALLGAAQGGAASDGPLATAQALGALARLAPGLAEAEQTLVDQLLSTAPASPEADAALARRLVNRQEKPARGRLTRLEMSQRDESDGQALLAELAVLRPDPTVQMQALLAAGADDDGWNDDYHGRIAVGVRLLLMQHEALWPRLAEALRSALAAGSWPRHRIALASLARCAEAMPQQFNRSAADLTQLLLQASRDAGSFNSRRFAITCLSYLRVITPEVLAALLRLTGDTEEVQQDALAAAARFNRLDPSLGEALPAELTAALTGPSVLRARTAVRLLQALGTSHAAQATPGLRRQIVLALAAALQDPGSRRPVWVSTEKTDGTLDQDLYQALLRVAGF